MFRVFKTPTADMSDGSTDFNDDPLGPPGTQRITYSFRVLREVGRKRVFLVEDQRLYFDPQYGFLDLSGTGITGVSMKARFKPK